MIDISALSKDYAVRRLDEADAEEILALCRGNTQFYRYCGAEPTREQVLQDLHILPPGKEASDKYYLGFFREDALVAVMDLIDGYPEERDCFIGFFMTNKGLQGRGIGSEIIREVCACLGESGYTAVNLQNALTRLFRTETGKALLRSVYRERLEAL